MKIASVNRNKDWIESYSAIPDLLGDSVHVISLILYTLDMNEI